MLVPAGFLMSTATNQLAASEVEEQILEIVRELLEELGARDAAAKVTPEASFDRDLGLGSLERVELLLRVEKRLRFRLPDEVAQHAESVREWARAIEEADWSRLSAGRYPIEQPGEAPPPFTAASSFWDVLRGHAERTPERVHIHLLEQDAGRDITYGELYQSAHEVAAGLIAQGLKREEAVAVMLPTCADFFSAFFGVTLAGGVAVPIYPPARPDKVEEYVLRQALILKNAGVRFLISFDEAKLVAHALRLRLPEVSELTTAARLREQGRAHEHVDAAPADIFFLQYTSGSTGDPKGVTLTHANVLANVQGIGWAVQANPSDTVVSWLPLYHDMGLIGAWLFSLFYAYPITILSPLDFLTRPERWLWALSDSGGTLCPAPNFSYELCARKISGEALEGVDLSRWRVAINAGEAVLPGTLERFAKRFAPYGFRPESYVPCYGLAESSVALTFPPIHRKPVIDAVRRDVFEREGRAEPAQPGDRRAIRFVANGKPLPGHEIRIIDGEGRDLPERRQGRVLFRGPSRTSGYYRNPEATRAAMDAEGWMDSGDLGYLAAGEIYITGRKKDCIIKAGHNIIPQEVEMAAAEVAGVRRGCVAAFGAQDRDSGTERMVVVAETRATRGDELERIRSEVVSAVDAAVGMPPDEVCLVPPQAVPKTSSGKVRRSETRKLYESGQLSGKKRPPWLQMLRLVSRSMSGWAALLSVGLSRGLRAAYRWATVFVLGIGGGLAARVLPSRRAAAWWASRLCRLLLALNGRSLRTEFRPGRGRAELLLANRSGRLDAVALEAVADGPLLLADVSLLSQAPQPLAFLLAPLVIPPAEEETAPPGGTLGRRIAQALMSGASVAMAAESRPGTPAGLSRFRLDVLRGAVEARAPLRPVVIQGRALDIAGGGVDSVLLALRADEAIEWNDRGHDSLVELRNRVRAALAATAQRRAS